MYISNLKKNTLSVNIFYQEKAFGKAVEMVQSKSRTEPDGKVAGMLFQWTTYFKVNNNKKNFLFNWVSCTINKTKTK